MAATEIDANPLYRQVRAKIIERLTDGTWKPGQMLPSEPALGAEFGVSPGTVRKALDELTAENIVTRRQGRGTFAADIDDNRVLFHFFRLAGPDGVKRFPESEVTAVARAPASPEERAALGLAANAHVVRIARIRRIDGTPVISETIAVPARSVPGLERLDPVPNNLYALYAARYGRVIARADESLTAASADAPTAAALGVATGTPLLRIARTGYTADDRPAEFRISLCRTDGHSYEVELR
ncbi:MAG: GntR family transcriptional regulator [Rhodobiaceae bacterium]|nr:GntR family transcriptional regulator [Rhodobiaceae bacterium]